MGLTLRLREATLRLWEAVFFSGKTGNSENLFESWNVVRADVHQRKVNKALTTAAIHLPRARKKSVVFDPIFNMERLRQLPVSNPGKKTRYRSLN